jgi:hypothetical protein
MEEEEPELLAIFRRTVGVPNSSFRVLAFARCLSVEERGAGMLKDESNSICGQTSH